MIKYLYNIGTIAGYDSIQHAINSIEADLDLGDPVTQDIIINVSDGTYPGFTIPDGALLPLLGTTYRLIIRSAGNYFPIIDFNRSVETQYVGIDVGSANPNVTIEGLRLQFFSVGIRAALNCHNIKISKCIISNNRNVGIFIDQCNNTQILQCVVSNGDFGIVTKLCKNIAIIHNTVFLNGSISTQEGVTKSAIWCQQARDYGNSEYGTLYLIGNIAWNTSGTCLTLFIDDVERGSIKSNFNDFVVGDSSKFIALEDCAFYEGAQASQRRFYNSLSAWKALGYDSQSISEDPKFFVPVRINSAKNKHAIDLNLLTVSPALGRVPSFFTDSEQVGLWLPVYVDSADLAKDILNNPRQQAGTAIGANDRASNAGFFGQDILTSPISSENAASCATSPLLDLIQKKLDLWYPKYKAGYFYSYDRDFYLYSKKRCEDIGYLCQTVFNLPSKIDTNRPIKVYVNGKRIEDSSYFDIRGHQFILYHKDLNIINWNEEIEIQYYVSAWGDLGFSYVETYVRFKIREGTSRYFLTEDYYPRGPVVITDDTTYPTNKDLFCNREFKLLWDSIEQKTEIIFSQNSNLITNPQFTYNFGEAPIGWDTIDATVTTGKPELQAVAGRYICELKVGDYIQQYVPTVTGESTLSFYAAALSGNRNLHYALSFYDTYNRDLGFVQTGAVSVSNDWKRYYITFGLTGSTNPPIADQDYPHEFITHIDVPDPASLLKVKLHTPLSNTGDVFVDAIQYELTSNPSTYHRKFYGNELTVEYETSSDEYFTDYNQSLSSSVSSITDGFLYIPELPASLFGGPRNPAVTTLHEREWKAGRKELLPWARLYGKDKLRKRVIFHTYPQNKYGITAPVLYTPSIKELSLTPSVPVALQGTQSPIQFSIFAVDRDNNPMARAKILVTITDHNQKFPGFLFKKKYGAKQQLGQSCYGLTDGAGAILLEWIPPSIEDSSISSKVPIPTSLTTEGQKISFIKTKYPVNLDYHGNVIVLDSNGNQLLTQSTNLNKGVYAPSKRNNYSVVRLPYPIVPGTIILGINNILYTETQNANPETNQYSVDYENSIITISGAHSSVTIEYIQSFVFINQNDPNKIQFYHDKVFGSYEGNITIGYDFIIKLTANITDDSVNTNVTKSFDLLAANYLTSSFNQKSDLYLEL